MFSAKSSLLPPMNRRLIPPYHHPKLLLLREYDQERPWRNLDDQRVCLLCGTEFNGHSIRVQIQSGSPRFLCPNIACRGDLPLFAVGGNPLLSETVWVDWMRLPTREDPHRKKPRIETRKRAENIPLPNELREPALPPQAPDFSPPNPHPAPVASV